MLGRIERVLVKEGERVSAGDIVVEMESADLRVQLEHARSRLEEARAKLAEVQRGPRPQELNTARTRVAESTAVLREARAALERGQLLESKSLISRSDLEEIVTRHERAAAQLDVANQEMSLIADGAPAEVRQMLAAQYRSAEAAVREVEVQLEYASIRAPMAGIVTRRFMEAGEVIIMQRPQPILTIADVSKLLVRAEVDESAVPRISVGQETTVRSSTHPTQRFSGRIVELAPSIGRKTISGEDPAEMVDSKVLEATIEMASGSQLMLGQTVDVEITTARRDSILAVPREAIEVRSAGSYVQVKSGSGWTSRRVRTGESQAGMIEIVEGVREGETVALHRPTE